MHDGRSCGQRPPSLGAGMVSLLGCLDEPLDNRRKRETRRTAGRGRNTKLLREAAEAFGSPRAEGRWTYAKGVVCNP